MVVAHGIFNYELFGALLTRRPEGIDHHWAYKGEHDPVRAQLTPQA